MKKYFGTFFVFMLLLICFYYKDDATRLIVQKINQNTNVSLPDYNNYDNNIDFKFVKKTDDFHIKSYQGFLDAIYTILASGADEFTFYCDESYKECMNDFSKISDDQVLLSTINNMVSPYNSYQKIYFKTNSFGTINMSVDKLYSNEEIKMIDNKLNQFISKNINDNMTAEDKIRAFHDYVINISVYDKERADIIESGKDIDSSNSHKATGPLIDGISLCSGYSDAMKLFLDKIGMTSYKISNIDHIWNLVYINDTWLHIDITWDNPVTKTGEKLLLHNFFLIDTNTLHELDPNGHNFNPEYYPEISH